MNKEQKEYGYEIFNQKEKTADKEIAAGRDDEKQEVQNQTEDDMDEESLANGRDNVIEVKRTMGQKKAKCSSLSQQLWLC